MSTSEAAPPASSSDPLASCPPARPLGTLAAAAVFTAADDVAAAADGSLWLSDARSLLEHVSAGGAVLQRISDSRAPEGIVVLADGTLVVAEQQADRVVRLDPSTRSERTLIQLTPRAGAEGVDGIGLDAAGSAVLVPDSANGTLLEVSLGSGAVTKLASGLGRPVDAAALPDGSLLVAVENAAGLLHVPAGGGAATPLGDVTQADDVVVAGSVAYVTSLTGDDVTAVDPSTGRAAELVTDDEMPQGLALLPGGRLAVTNSSTGLIATFAGC